MENCPPEKAPLEERCYEAVSCTDVPCQDKIVERHRISEECFIKMVSAFKNSIYQPKKYSGFQIEILLLTLDCTKGHHIAFTADEHLFTNEDIKLRREYNPIDGKYSLAFINGLIRQYDVKMDDEFHFYKAIDLKNNKATLAMKLYVNGENVFFGDLVGLYP